MEAAGVVNEMKPAATVNVVELVKVQGTAGSTVAGRIIQSAAEDTPGVGEGDYAGPNGGSQNDGARLTIDEQRGVHSPTSEGNMTWERDGEFA